MNGVTAMVLAFAEATAIPSGSRPVREEVSLAIIPVLVGAKKEVGLSAVNEEVGSAAAMRPSLRVIVSEELFVKDSDEASLRLRECGADEDCIARELSSLSVKLGMLVVINTVLDTPVLSIRVVDVEKKLVVDRESGALTPQESTLRAAIRSRSSRLFDRLGHPRLGRLRVVTSPAGADVEVAETGLLDRSPATFWVPPGRHRVIARLHGHQVVEEWIEVGTGTDREASLELSPEESSWLAEPWLWGAASLAAALTVVMVVIIAQPRDLCVCLGAPGSRCDC